MQTFWYIVEIIGGICFMIGTVIFIYIARTETQVKGFRKGFPVMAIGGMLIMLGSLFYSRLKAEETWVNAVTNGYTFYLDGDVVDPNILDMGYYLDKSERPIYIEESKKVLLTSKRK